MANPITELMEMPTKQQDNRYTEALFLEQREFLRTHQQEIFGEYIGVKVGLDLNLTIYFTAVMYFHLKKKYTWVHPDILQDRFLIEEFDYVLDSTLIEEGTDFSLKDSLKNEVKLSILSHYVMRIYKKKVFPSEVRRKERALNNAIARAHKKIDQYFKDRDIRYSELQPIVDIFEVIVNDQGTSVNFHFGEYGFTMEDDKSSTEILAYVDTRKQANRHIEEEIQLAWRNIDPLWESLVAFSPNLWKQIEQQFVTPRDLKYRTMEEVKAIITSYKERVLRLHAFLKETYRLGFTLPEHAVLRKDFATIKVDAFLMDVQPDNAAETVSQYHAYCQTKSFIDVIEQEAKEKQLRVLVQVKKNYCFFQIVPPRSLANLKFEHQGRPSMISLNFLVGNGYLQRETGEQVLTKEVVLFEMEERVRNAGTIFIQSVERAKEMLLSTLTADEEKLFLEQDITFVEGEKNFYALVAGALYHNNVVKIPKNLQSIEDIKTLCTHPEDSNVPMYDGFAAISLAVKSGDEEYVLQHSNEFRLNDRIKERLQRVLPSFAPLRQLQLT